MQISVPVKIVNNTSLVAAAKMIPGRPNLPRIQPLVHSLAEGLKLKVSRNHGLKREKMGPKDSLAVSPRSMDMF